VRGVCLTIKLLFFLLHVPEIESVESSLRRRQLHTIGGGVEAVRKVVHSEDVIVLSYSRLAPTVTRFEVRDSEGLEGFIVNEIEEVREGG
jgi:hypothetical protein